MYGEDKKQNMTFVMFYMFPQKTFQQMIVDKRGSIVLPIFRQPYLLSHYAGPKSLP